MGSAHCLGLETPGICWQLKGSRHREGPSVGQPFPDTGLGVMELPSGANNMKLGLCEKA